MLAAPQESSSESKSTAGDQEQRSPRKQGSVNESTNHKDGPPDDDNRLRNLFGPSKRSYDGRVDYSGNNFSA